MLRVALRGGRAVACVLRCLVCGSRCTASGLRTANPGCRLQGADRRLGNVNLGHQPVGTKMTLNTPPTLLTTGFTQSIA